MTVKIAITDDHPLVLKGIESMLSGTDEIQVSGLYPTGKITLDNIRDDAPDVLLLDINLPDADGMELCKKILGIMPEMKVIALTNFEELSFVKRMMACGAHGYLLKNTERAELLTALKTVLQGEQYLQKDIRERLLGAALGQRKKTGYLPKLTQRDKEVLAAIAEELTTREISEKLFISTKTVETHRMNLMSKFGARNSVGLIKKAIEKGLLK